MAATKRVTTTWLCETDADREEHIPHVGQMAVMKDGTIYVCFQSGTWTKTDISGGGAGGQLLWGSII